MNLLRARTPAVQDTLIACFFLVAMQVEVWAFWVPDEQGPKAFAAVMGVLIVVPLLWRRRAPLGCLLAADGVLLAWVLVAVPQGSLWPLLTTLALTFSLAIHSPRRPAVIGLVATFGVWVFFVARTTNSMGDYGFIEAFVVAAWVAGRAIRARQLRAEELFRRTVRLEVEREEEARLATERERARIARELHDIISHSVSVMVVQAGAAELVLEQDLAQVRESLRSIQETGRQSRLELRRLLGLMRADGEAAALAPQPGLAELDALVQPFRYSGLQVDLDLGELPELAPGIDLTAYRIVQEALTNALKHGGRGEAVVSISNGHGSLDITVRNRGDAPSAEEGGGFGFVGMSERIALYGGRLEHGHATDGWYELRARLPLDEVVR